MNEMTAINVTYSGSTEQAVQGFAKLLIDNVSHDSEWHQVHERIVKFGNGTMGSYWMGQSSLIVEAEQLNNCLVQVDTVKHGFIPNAAEVFSQIHRDVRIEIGVDNTVSSVIPLKQMCEYLHNKEQEQSRAIAELEGQVNNLTKLCEGYDEQIQSLTHRLDEQYAFLHSYIDFNAMKQVLVATAEKVDKDILEDFPIHKIH